LTNAATVGDTITTISFYVSSVLNAIQQYNGSSTNQTLTTPTLTTPTMSAATLTGTSTFAGGVANAYGFGVGTAVPSSGAGIAFPATQSASSDANTLDDYEEGTWTPTGGSLTNNVTATYTKVGRLVYATYDVTFPSGGAATQAQINGLPFTSLTPGGGGSIGYTNYSPAITLNIERSTTYFVFVQFGGTNITFANLNGVRIIGTLVYSV
jgi:hypothetical protein